VFNARFFAADFFAPRYWPEAGADAVVTPPGATRYLALSTASGYLVLSQTA
jgi:hypothetical protein